MSRIGFALSLLVIVLVAGWTYHVNYETAEAWKRVRALEARIAAEQERLAVLTVEWARLNNPDRLRRLVAEHNGRLMLMPVAPDHFGSMDVIPWPPRGTPEDPGDAPPLARAPVPLPLPGDPGVVTEQAAWRRP